MYNIYLGAITLGTITAQSVLAAMRIKTSSKTSHKYYKRDTDNTRSVGSDSTDSPRLMTGALRSPYDPNDTTDYIFEKLALGPDNTHGQINDYVDLRPYSKPSRHQRNRGTCAAFAVATIREIQEHLIGAVPDALSPEFIYHHRKNKPSEGMFARDAFAIMREIGTVPEELFPYQDHEPTTNPVDHHYDIAADHRFTNFARVLTCAGLKRAVREIGPCYLVLPLYTTRPSFWRKRSHDNTDGHGHSLAVVGYNHDGFILKNSWGPNWNGDGCIIFPYADWDTHWECWAPLNRDVVMPEYSHVALDATIGEPLVRDIKEKNRCIIS